MYGNLRFRPPPPQNLGYYYVITEMGKVEVCRCNHNFVKNTDIKAISQIQPNFAYGDMQGFNELNYSGGQYVPHLLTTIVRPPASLLSTSSIVL